MAKGPNVTQSVEVLIAAVYQEHPGWKAPMIQREVSYLLHKNNPKLPSGWPGLSIIQKILATIRSNAKILPDDPQAKPWNMATLGEYPLPPETLYQVLEVNKLYIDNEQIGFSIRVAKWAARLSALFTAPVELAQNADQYARLEEIYRLIDRPFDSTVFDWIIMGVPIEQINKILGFIPWAALFTAQKGGMEKLKNRMKTIKKNKKEGGKP